MWGMGRIDSASTGAADSVPGVTVLPFVSLGDVLTPQQRTVLAAKLTSLGYSSSWVRQGVTVETAILTVGRILDPNFSPDWLSVIG